MGAAPPIRLHSQSSPPEPTPSTMRPPPPSRCDTASLGGRHQAGVTPRHLVARRRAGGDSHAGHSAPAVPGGGSVAPWCRHKRPNTPLVAPCTLLGPHRRQPTTGPVRGGDEQRSPKQVCEHRYTWLPPVTLRSEGPALRVALVVGEQVPESSPLGKKACGGGNACRGRPLEELANSRATALLSSHRALGLVA